MPPKVRIHREEIIEAGIDIVRTQGEAALNARSVAAVLQCSTQPVFSNFATMQELRLAVIAEAEKLYKACMQQEMNHHPPYKASGMAYIRFAKEEKELFKLLFMRDRSDEVIPEQTELDCQMEQMVHSGTGLEGEEARLFHLEMWAYVHGIAVILASGYLELDMARVSRMLTDAYQGLKKQFRKE